MPQPVFVHFPHPGSEHNPGRAARQAWNTNSKHRRKFLRSLGRYVGPNGALADALLVFWGEWEAPSYVIQRWPVKDDLPRYLQEARWERPKSQSSFRQNTDPWVFGDCSHYSNCHQLNQSGLQNLAAGSVILFGSTLGLASDAGPGFVLDTLFVVAEQRQRFTPTDPPKIDEVFRVCTIEPLATGGNPDRCGAAGVCGDANAWFTLYTGATYEAQIKGMYSFAPCRRIDRDNFRFARPALSLPAEIVNPWSWQSPKGAGRPRPIDEIIGLWAIVRDQVLAAGCLLGVYFSTPPEDRTGSQSSSA